MDEISKRIVILGRKYDLWSDRVLPVISGADGDEPNVDLDEPSEPETVATFTQADVDRIAAKEKKQGRQAALKEIADDLGVTPAQAKAIIEKANAADEAAMTETERARAEAIQAKADADADRAAAAAERVAAKVERKLSTAGIAKTEDNEKADKAIARVARVARILDVPADADDDAIDEAIALLKADLPALFTTTTQEPAGAPSGVSVGGKGKPAPSGKTPLGKGAEAYAQRQASKPTFTGASA